MTDEKSHQKYMTVHLNYFAVPLPLPLHLNKLRPHWNRTF